MPLTQMFAATARSSGYVGNTSGPAAPLRAIMGRDSTTRFSHRSARRSWSLARKLVAGADVEAAVSSDLWHIRRGIGAARARLHPKRHLTARWQSTSALDLVSGP
jgi:hypothetical protein